jgi:hypothetical protein
LYARTVRNTSIADEIGALWNERMMKVRRGDSRESWSDLNLRIAELRERLDRVEAHTACSYCGAGRPTTAVRVFDARQRKLHPAVRQGSAENAAGGRAGSSSSQRSESSSLSRRSRFVAEHRRKQFGLARSEPHPFALWVQTRKNRVGSTWESGSTNRSDRGLCAILH